MVSGGLPVCDYALFFLVQGHAPENMFLEVLLNKLTILHHARFFFTLVVSEPKRKTVKGEERAAGPGPPSLEEEKRYMTHMVNRVTVII